MQFKYGDYEHDENDVSAVFTREPLMSDGGTQIGYKLVINMSGRLSADTQAGLTSGLDALRDAYAVNGKDLILFDNNSAESHVKIVDSGSETGVMIKKLDIPNLKNAQYTTYIDYSISAEAEYITNRVLYETYQNSLNVTGNGGAVIKILPGVNGLTTQQVYPNSAVIAMESGSASRTGAIPLFPPPMFPSLLVNEAQSKTYDVRNKDGKTIYVAKWNYKYQSNSQISGVPIPRG